MIRHFSLSDLDRILEIESLAFPKSPYDTPTFIRLHCQYPNTFWVYVGPTSVRKGNEIWGYIVFSTEGHIISIAVHLERRRTGIGKELIQRMLEQPRIKKIMAEVRKNNRGAQTFYRSLGFQTVGVIPNYYGDEDALVMEKRR